MNSVRNLKTRPFSSLTLEEKLELKELGPHKPNLNIEQVSKGKERPFKRKFNPEWYKKTEWLCGCDSENALFCFPCLLFSGDDVWTKTGIRDLKHLGEKTKTHSFSRRHLNCTMELAMLGRVNIETQLDSGYRLSVKRHNEKVEKNRYILSKLIDCIKFCGAFELALRGHDESENSENPGVFRGLVNFVATLDSAMKEHLDSATVFIGTSKTIQNELLDCMLNVCKDHITQEIKDAHFLAIQADETTDVMCKLQMVLVYRYERQGSVVERFWSFMNPSNASADALSELILSELQLQIKEDPEKLISQSYDGASVMKGQISGVQARVRTQYPYAYYVHCYAHQLNLIMEQAASKIKKVRIFFANLSAFPSFFSRSPKRTAVLDAVVAKRLPRPVSTRWNFKSRSVNVVYEQKEQLIECFETILDSNDFDQKTLQEASGLLRMMKDNSFLFWLAFFHHIMPHTDILYNQLQKRQTDPLQINSAVAQFKASVNQVREQVNCIQDETADTPDVSVKRRRIEEEGEGNNILAKEVCDIIINQAEERFSFSNHLVVSKLLDSCMFEKYFSSFPEDELKIAVGTYPLFDIAKLRTELQVIYSREDFRKAQGAIPLLQLFLENKLENVFSETVKLLRILITTPMTTAESERVFSTLKRIKTLLRNSMLQDRLNALTMLSVEKRLVSEINNFNQKVIEKFAKLKNRRLEFLFK